MEVDSDPGWSFLTNHGLVLLVIANDPRSRMRDIADAIGVTERTAQRVVTDLINGGYLSRERPHRRNVYTVLTGLTVRLPLAREIEIGELLAVLAPPGSAAAADHAAARAARAEGHAGAEDAATAPGS